MIKSVIRHRRKAFPILMVASALAFGTSAIAYTGEDLAKDTKIDIQGARDIAVKARAGKLTDEELTQARQAHNRGGKELETDPKRIQEFMERRKADWKKQNQKWLDENNDGKIDGPEEQQAETIWR